MRVIEPAFFRVLFCLPLLCLGPPGSADPATDRAATTTVDSEQLWHDEKRSISVFTGNVRVSKGSLLMRGDRLELRQMPNGFSRSVLIGGPALIRQRRAIPNEWMVGRADRIDYDSETEVAILVGNAVMSRLEGESERDRIAGDRLVYNSVEETYHVQVEASGGRATMSVMPSAAGTTANGRAPK